MEENNSEYSYFQTFFIDSANEVSPKSLTKSLTKEHIQAIGKIFSKTVKVDE